MKLVSSDISYGKIKTASLRWHSPMLDDISAVRPSLSLITILSNIYTIHLRIGKDLGQSQFRDDQNVSS